MVTGKGCCFVPYRKAKKGGTAKTHELDLVATSSRLCEKVMGTFLMWHIIYCHVIIFSVWKFRTLNQCVLMPHNLSKLQKYFHYFLFTQLENYYSGSLVSVQLPLMNYTWWEGHTWFSVRTFICFKGDPSKFKEITVVHLHTPFVL